MYNLVIQSKIVFTDDNLPLVVDKLARSCKTKEDIFEAYILVKPNLDRESWYGIQLEQFLSLCDDDKNPIDWPT